MNSANEVEKIRAARVKDFSTLVKPSANSYGFLKDTVGKPRDGCVVVIQSLSNKGLR